MPEPRIPRELVDTVSDALTPWHYDHDGMRLAKPSPHGSYSDSIALTHCICWGSAFIALHAVPDGWAKVDGEWIRVTSDGVGYGEFDRDHSRPLGPN